MSSLESSLHSQPKSHQRQSSSSCTPPPSQPPSSPSSLTNSGSVVVSSSVNTSTERQNKNSSQQNATVLSVGQGFVMLPPHTRMGSLNVPHDVLETSLEFGHSDFNPHYGNPGDQHNMFLFAPNPFLPDLGNKFTHLSGPRDNVSLHDAIEMAQQEKYINMKERLTPVQAQEDNVRGNKNIMLPSSHSVISSVARYSNCPSLSTSTPSSNVTTSIASSSGFTRPNVLQFQGGSGPSAMLGSAVYAGEGDLLNEGGLEVPGSTGFNSLDGLLGSSIGNNSNSNSIRLPDLLDREVSQEGYLDVSAGSTSLRLSPNTFDQPVSSSFGDRNRLGVITDNGLVDISSQRDSNGKTGTEVSTNATGSLSVNSNSSLSNFTSTDKLKVKPKVSKVTSPSGRAGTQPCPTCGKVFSNSSALTKHKLTHSDERKFVCQLCAKAFKRQDHLNGHMLTHRNKKPYECDVNACGKSYCDARSLRRHKENHHNNSSSNPILPSSRATALIPVQVGSNCVIPTIPHLNLNSLQSAFSAGLPRVVTNGGDPSTTVTSNRIRYAPPLSQETSTLSQLLGSILPSAATQLQFLAFQQAPTPPPPNHQQNHLSQSNQLQQQQNQLQTQIQQQNQLQTQIQQQTHSQQNETQQQTNHIQQNQLQLQNQMQHNQLQGSIERSEIQNQQICDRNQNDSPNNSSQAIDLTSVAPATCTTSSQIVSVSQDNNVNASWHHNFQTMIMDDNYVEGLKRNCKESTVDKLSSNVNEKLSLNDANSKSEPDCKPSLECIPSSDMYQSFHRESSPSRSNLQSVLDYATVSAVNLTHLSEGNVPDDGNRTVLAIKTEVEERKEMMAPLLQQLLTPNEPRSSQSKENVSETISNMENQAQGGFSISQDDDEQNNDEWNRNQCLTDSVSLSNYCSNELPKSVECTLCQRKFKNVPALNGHMRLHGGYFKKDGENKKMDKKPNLASSTQSVSTLQTASVNVRALIEEKIIQRQQRIGKSIEMTDTSTEPSVSEQQRMNELSSSTCDLPFISEESYTLSIPETPSLEEEATECLLVSTQHSNEDYQDPAMDDNPFEPNNSSSSLSQQLDEHHSLVNDSTQISAIPKLPSVAPFRHTFRVPRPVVEKNRRHSDSDPFVSMKRPCTDHVNSAVASFLRRKVAARRTTRTGSDPGGDFNQFFSNAFSESDFDQCLIDFNQTVQQVESLPATPTYRPIDLFSSFPLPPDQQCGTQFSFLERDLVLSSLDNPPLPSDTEFLDYGNQNDQRLDENMDVVSEHNDNLLDNAVHPSTSVFQSGDLMENSYSLCPSINALLDDPMDTEGTPLEDPKPPILENDTEIVLNIPVKAEILEEKSDFLNIKEEPSNEATPWPNPTDDTEDDVFLSPTSIPASPIKPRVKHRPEPLFIPPHVNTGGGVFASRLRSPRLRECSVETKTLSPPPYTPPPMLSPVRNGPGLFWHILSTSSGGNVTPKSAPITPNLLSRKVSLTEEPVEEVVSDTPETDILPHVNIGTQFQAQLPKCRERKGDFELRHVPEKADRLWHPSVINGLLDEDVDSYLELACTATVPGGGRNKEYALHILQLKRGNIEQAIAKLVEPNPKLRKGHPLLTYKYLETDKWLTEQSECFQQALMKFGKDFFSISKELGSKTVRECVQFYYIWKKIHPEEYKRFRSLRRKREQESLFYNLRPKSNNNNNNDEEQQNNQSDIEGQFAAVNDLLSAKISFMLPSPTGSPSGRSASPASTAGDNPGAVVSHFPCKICGKVFPKVKSRSAHMKSHRQTDADKNFSGGKLSHFQSQATSK